MSRESALVGSVIEFAGHWGVGKTTLALGLVAELEGRVDVSYGRRLGHGINPAKALATDPMTAIRLLAATGGHLPELARSRAAKRIAAAHLRYAAAVRKATGLVVLDRGAVGTACAVLASQPPVSDRLLTQLMPRNAVTVLVEAPPAVVKQRVATEAGRDPESFRGSLGFEELTSPVWQQTLAGYQLVKAAMMATRRPVLVVENEGAVDFAALAEQVLRFIDEGQGS